MSKTTPKVLIVTLWDYKNFGNRLQAIALKKIIESMGYCVVFAVYKKCSGIFNIKKFVKEILGFLGVSRYIKDFRMKSRFNALKKCYKMYQPVTDEIFNFSTEGKINPNDYVAAVTGSDQVWHRWAEKLNELPYFYLTFMPEYKRISYAASFGFEEFPPTDFIYHQNGLQGMRFISCREESGCRMVEKFTGKHAELVLDPTLCVDKEFWSRIEEKPNFYIPERYMLLFMLGDKSAYSQVINSYAQENCMKIIDLYDINCKNVWKTNIGNFLWLVHNAEYICTDSFHCTVFSILYETRFTVFRRQQKGFESMFNRIETLLHKTGLETSIYDNNDIRMAVSINYEQVKSKLALAKDDSLEWLKNALYIVSQTK